MFKARGGVCAVTTAFPLAVIVLVLPATGSPELTSYGGGLVGPASA